MKKHPFPILFYATLVILAVGHGLIPLLPLYASEFGAAPRLIGGYLASLSGAITLGALLPSLLPESLSRKQLLVWGSAVGVPALVLLGTATEFWQVMLWTASLWFCAGLCLALISVYTGMLSGAEHRGRSFSMMALSTPLSLLLGGLAMGSLVGRLGFAHAFLALAALWATIPCVVMLAFQEMAVGGRTLAPSPRQRQGPRSWAFPLLLLAAFLSAATVSSGQIGTSLAMQVLAFPPTAVGSTTTAAGLAMIPLVLLIGPLSDRLGRVRFLILGYCLSAAGALALTSSGALWHFWVAMALLRAGQAVNEAIAPAVATDLLPSSAWRRGLPRLKSVNWLAAMLSFLAAGYVIELLGLGLIFVAAAGMAAAAAVLLILLPVPVRPPKDAAAHTPPMMTPVHEPGSQT